MGWGRCGVGKLGRQVGAWRRSGASPCFAFSLAHCSGGGKVDARYGVSPSARLVEPGEAVPKGGGVYRVGSPYMVAGRVYVPEDDPHYRAEGVASWYGADFHGRATANGEIFDADSISAAHPTLPLPSYVAGDQCQQRPLADRARQRSRALCR